jgi:hypothetical protein
LIVGIYAARHHERAAHVVACVSDGDNSAVDARAGGVYVVDEDNALRRAFLGAGESVARWLVEAENAGASAQQRPARHCIPSSTTMERSGCGGGRLDDGTTTM